MPSNQAAYQPSKQAPALIVRDAPYPKAAKGQIIVRNAAVAINPLDWLIQARGDIMFTHLKYPAVLGTDMAGEVVEVGPGVTRFNIGDRVLGLGLSWEETVNDPAEGAFQNFAVLREDCTTPLPPSLPYEQAAVLPLGLITAATGLFDKTQLGLQLPSVPAKPAKGETVIVWGGSTSVGCNAIQLAVAAGYEVVTTASPRNFDLVRRLGATRVWDYRSVSVVDDMVAYLKDRTMAGALAIGDDSAVRCMSVLDGCKKGRKFVAMATFPVSKEAPSNLVILRTMVPLASFVVSYKIKGIFNGVKSAFVAVKPLSNNGITRHIFAEFLPKALQAGTFVTSPTAEVVGHGLENVQKAFDLQRQGISAKKLVVTL